MVFAEYIPACGEQFNSVWARGLKYKAKDGRILDMKFFTKNSHFEYPIMLQSCYYGMEGVGKKAETNYRDMVGFPKDKTLVGDSGGFQIASFKKRGEVCPLNAIDSLRWQEANCDIGMNMDVPPTLGKVVSLKDFMIALETSIENFDLFVRERKNYDMRLLNVLHGETKELMDIWYNRVKDYKFDGWAVGMKPPFDPFIQAVGFMYLWEKGEFKKPENKNLHFFGTSGKYVVPLIVYAASKIPHMRVTYDSSSYNIGSIYRTYYSPFDMGPHLSFGEKFARINPNLKELPCECPVCNSISNIEELNTTDIYAGTLISLHNMYQYIYYNNILNKLVLQKDKFLEYLKKTHLGKRAIVSIEFIDYAMEKGLESALVKYKQWYDKEGTIITKQVSIYDSFK